MDKMGMDTEMFLEVPDTPDRLADRHIREAIAQPFHNCSKDFNLNSQKNLNLLFQQAEVARQLSASSSEIQNAGTKIEKIERLNGREKSSVSLAWKSGSENNLRSGMCKDNEGFAAGPAGLSSVKSSMLGNPFQIKSIGSFSPSKLAPRMIDEAELAMSNDDDFGVEQRRKGKEVDLNCGSPSETEKFPSAKLQIGTSHRSTQSTRLGRTQPMPTLRQCKGIDLLEDVVENGVGLKKDLQFSELTDDEGSEKTTNLNGNQINKCSNEHLNSLASSKKYGSRRLVRNGCISPNNIAAARSFMCPSDVPDNKAGWNGINDISHRTLPDHGRSIACVKKGKAVVDFSMASGDTKPLPDRKRISVSASADVDIPSFKDKGLEGSRSCVKNHKAVVGDEVYINALDSPESVAVNELLDPIVDQAPGVSGHERRFIGKRKCNVSRPRVAESSSLEEEDILFLETSDQPNNSKPKRNIRSSRCLNSRRNRELEPVIEVDELDPYNLGNRDMFGENSQDSANSSSSRAKQVESDELIARLLQEELYCESLGLGGTEELDATIARSLQRQEDAMIGSYVARRAQPLLNVRLDIGSPSSSVRLAAPYRFRSSTRLAELRRIFRINIEANYLEGSVDLHPQRDFDENDYEMLLALDVNNQQVGTSENRINILPQSVVQVDNIEEACSICLETPTVGDTIRHLPCLHKFHKECIDVWLRKKSSCPICKSDVT